MSLETHINTYIQDVEDAYQEVGKAMANFYDKVTAMRGKYEADKRAVETAVPKVEQAVETAEKELPEGEKLLAEGEADAKEMEAAALAEGQAKQGQKGNGK